MREKGGGCGRRRPRSPARPVELRPGDGRGGWVGGVERGRGGGVAFWECVQPVSELFRVFPQKRSGGLLTAGPRGFRTLGSERWRRTKKKGAGARGVHLYLGTHAHFLQGGTGARRPPQLSLPTHHTLSPHQQNWTTRWRKKERKRKRGKCFSWQGTQSLTAGKKRKQKSEATHSRGGQNQKQGGRCKVGRKMMRIGRRAPRTHAGPLTSLRLLLCDVSCSSFVRWFFVLERRRSRKENRGRKKKPHAGDTHPTFTLPARPAGRPHAGRR